MTCQGRQYLRQLQLADRQKRPSLQQAWKSRSEGNQDNYREVSVPPRHMMPSSSGMRMKIPIETAAKGRGKDRVPKKRLKIDFDGDLFDGPGKILDLDLEGGETLDIKYV
jgi:hypothetical protein